MYKVEWEKEALKELAKIDRVQAEKIRLGVETVLAKNPYKEGKPLKGDLKGRRSFRFSKYRVIHIIKEDKLLIQILEVGHRREIY